MEERMAELALNGPILSAFVLFSLPLSSTGQDAMASKSRVPSTRMACYVDPDWHGEAKGVADAPWTHLDRPAWRAINEELAVRDVTVYFSAREAAEDTDERTTRSVQILRTDTSAHRLALDGMSLYNANDEAPVWQANTGKRKLHITAPYPINSATRSVKRSYVTVRGFKTLSGAKGRGGQGVAYWGGDHVVIEHCEVTHHPNVAHGPGIIFNYAWNADGSPRNGGCTGLSIRHNIVHGVYGEGIYVGGSHDVDKPAHRNVTIESNVVYDVAVYGGEGDAIDVKDGSTNVVIRGNTCYMTKPGAGRDGIVCGSNCVIEGNLIYHFGRAGISLGTYWNAHRVRDGSVVRNNIIVRTGGNPKYSWDYGIIVSGSKDGDNWTNMSLLNNTVFGVRSDRDAGGVGIEIRRFAKGAKVLNNIVSGCAGYALSAEAENLTDHCHNLYHSPRPDALLVRCDRRRFSAGTLAQFEPGSLSADPQFVSTEPSYTPANFSPRPGSPVVGAGAWSAGVTTDFFGRPRREPWDLGAVSVVPRQDRHGQPEVKPRNTTDGVKP